MRKWLPLFLFALLAPLAMAQSTTVSGSVTDTGAQTWNNGTFQFTFVPNPAYPNVTYTWTGGVLPTNISGVLNGVGAYSASIPSTSAISPIGATWVATFCPLATWACYTTASTTVQGPTQTLNATPPAIAINLVNPPASIMRAYSDSEIAAAVIASQYYNLTTAGYRYCSAVSGQTCTTWNNLTGSGGTPSFAVVTSGTNPNSLLVSGTLGPTGPGVLLASALNTTPTQCTGLQFSTGVAANGNANCATPSGVSVAWNAVTNPTAAQALTMGYTTTFNYTSPLASAFAWANTTAATSSVSQSSPQEALTGQCWNGSASTADSWSWGVTETNGTNGASIFNFAHTGCSGPAVMAIPGALSAGTAVGGNTGIVIPETTVPTLIGTTAVPAAGLDVCYGDSTAHDLLCSYNNGPFITSSGPTLNNRVCDIYFGNQNSGDAVLGNLDLGPQSRVCFIPAAATILEMDVNADTGTPSIIIGRNHAGTITNIVSSALATAASGGIACSNTGGTTGLNGATTCSGTLQNTALAVGDYIEAVSGTAGGAARSMAAHIIYRIN